MLKSSCLAIFSSSNHTNGQIQWNHPDGAADRICELEQQLKEQSEKTNNELVHSKLLQSNIESLKDQVYMNTIYNIS